MKKLTTAIKHFEKKLKAEECLHPHIQFDIAGHYLMCIDCPRQWRPVTAQGGIEYSHYEMRNSMQTRHTPFEAPRTSKKRA